MSTQCAVSFERPFRAENCGLWLLTQLLLRAVHVRPAELCTPSYVQAVATVSRSTKSSRKGEDGMGWGAAEGDTALKETAIER